MTEKITGLLVVKDQAYTVRMALKSTKHVCDEYIIVDNDSTDKTYDVLECAISDFNLNATLRQKSGYVRDIFYQIFNEANGLKLRIEGDQIFFKDRLQKAVNSVNAYQNLRTTSIILEPRLDYQHKEWETNLPHFTLHGSQIKLVIQENTFWPKPGNGQIKVIEKPPLSVNAGIHEPYYRLKRWHRSGTFGVDGTWWNRYNERDHIPEHMKLENYKPPYQDHMTMEEYMRILRERGKGSMKWSEESLEDAAEKYVEWEMRNICKPYNREYPKVLQEYIYKYGYEMPRSEKRLIT